MSTHSYSRLWTHLVWETLNREPMLDKRAGQGFDVPRPVLARKRHLQEDQLLQCDHTHALIDLPYEMFVKRYGLEWRSEKNH